MKQKINWPLVLGCVGFLGISAGWAVTASTTENNKSEIKETQKDVQDLKAIVIKQTAQTEAQQSYNADVAKILEKMQK